VSQTFPFSEQRGTLYSGAAGPNTVGKMRLLLASLILEGVLGGPGLFAQPTSDANKGEPASTHAIASLPLGNHGSPEYFHLSTANLRLASTLPPSIDISSTIELDRNPSTPGIHRFGNLTIESFGYGPNTPRLAGFEFSPDYTAAMFNLHGLECPRCAIGPVDRARSTLPPFGANVTLRLRDGRIELFAGVGALEAWKADVEFEPKGFQKFSNTYGDAWLSQAMAGGRIALDRDHHFWLGATARHAYNFGAGTRQWSSITGDATFRFGR
jgi:hypothetical protein